MKTTGDYLGQYDRQCAILTHPTTRFELRRLRFLTGGMALLAAILVVLSGCATDNPLKDSVAFIHPGVTGRAELVDNLGAPEIELKEQHALAFVRERVRTINNTPTSVMEHDIWEGANSTHHRSAIFVILDNNGVVQRFEAVSCPLTKSISAQLSDWTAGKELR